MHSLLLAGLLAGLLPSASAEDRPTVAVCAGGNPADFASYEDTFRLRFVPAGADATLSCTVSGDGWQLRAKGTDGLTRSVTVSAPTSSGEREALCRSAQALYLAISAPPGGLRSSSVPVTVLPASELPRATLDLDEPIAPEAPVAAATEPVNGPVNELRDEPVNELRDEPVNELRDEPVNELRDEPVNEPDPPTVALDIEGTRDTPRSSARSDADRSATKPRSTPSMDLDTPSAPASSPAHAWLSVGAAVVDRPSSALIPGVDMALGVVVAHQLWIGAQLTSLPFRAVLENPTNGNLLEEGQVSLRDVDAQLHLEWSPFRTGDRPPVVAPLIGLAGGVAMHTWYAYGAVDHTTTAILGTVELGASIPLDQKTGVVSLVPLVSGSIDIGPTSVGTPDGVPIFLPPFQVGAGVQVRVRMPPATKK